jgi:ribosomal protein S18 acetylase RimI-like enzyme
MEIRKAALTDLEQLCYLFDKYRVFYQQPSDVAAAKIFLEERFNKNESVVLVAEEANSLWGFTQLYPIFSSVSMKRTWLLNDLFVDERARKKGVAQALLNAAAAFGSQSGAKWLLLQTGNDNQAAQALYEKTGWNRVDDYFYQYNLS